MVKIKPLAIILVAMLWHSTAAIANTAQTKTETNGMVQPAADTALPVLDAEPNQLYGIAGLHSGRVPLNTISPQTLKTFVQAVDLMRREYIEPVDDEALFYQAINGMLTGIDRNAEFLDAAAFANLNSFTAGNVASVGLKAAWQPSEAHWVVSEVLADSPAKMVGIAAGDYLHQIGDVKLTPSLSENDIEQLLSGIAGSSVDVTYSRAGRSKQTANLLRNQMQKSNIEMLLQNDIVIIKLPVFQNNTRQEIIDKLSAISTPVQGVIIDLRNNPGGVLDAAVDVASLFMRKKVVTQVQNRTGIERVLETQGSPILESMPVIILQNRYSASAAEVLSSSLQTHERALIVGETSYGKGSVQSIVPIGRNQGIKLTTARYLTPKGAKIDKIGVVPDVRFDPAADSSSGDEWLKLSLNLMDKAKERSSQSQ